jgi:hypothetical protein
MYIDVKLSMEKETQRPSFVRRFTAAFEVDFVVNFLLLKYSAVFLDSCIYMLLVIIIAFEDYGMGYVFCDLVA